MVHFSRVLFVSACLACLPATAHVVDLRNDSSVPLRDDAALATIPLGDGGFIAAGFASREGLLRMQASAFLPNSILDPAFGIGGFAVQRFAGLDAAATAVSATPEGGFYLGGWATDGIVDRFAIARLDGQGRPSMATTRAVGDDASRGLGVATTADGSAVLVGWAMSGGRKVFALARFARNGALDAAFGAGGIVLLPLGDVQSWAEAIAVQADGKLVVAGTADGLLTVVRLRPDGVPDSTFGSSGIVRVTGGFQIGTAIALQGDGKIVVGGDATAGGGTQFGVVRLNPDGILDWTFFAAGTQKIPFPSSTARVKSLALQEDGRILLAGRSLEATTYRGQVALARVMADGFQDLTFGSNGIVERSLGDEDYFPGSVEALPGGRLRVVGGLRTPTEGWDLAIAEFTGDGTLDRSFRGSGIARVDASRPRMLSRDLDHDGQGDIVWQNTNGMQVSWLMDGSRPSGVQELVGPGTGWTVKLTADFDGNGTADIVWQHTDGTVVMWLMNGTTVTGGSTLMGAGTGWTPQFTGDFDGDGKADLMWRNADGRQHLWLMNGTTITGGAQLVGAGSGWTVKQLPDLNGDGKADILFQHTDGTVIAWLMNGATQITSATLVGAGGWSAIQVGDLDGDGKSDILWRHTDGTVIAWLLNGTTQLSSRLLVTAGPWTVTKVGDFNGDGKADLVWRNTVDGTIILWLMDGTAATQTPVLVGANSGWDVQAIGDYNGDGKDDLVWRHADGTSVMWLMDGASPVGGGQLVGPGTGWRVMP